MHIIRGRNQPVDRAQADLTRNGQVVQTEPVGNGAVSEVTQPSLDILSLQQQHG